MSASKTIITVEVTSRPFGVRFAKAADQNAKGLHLGKVIDDSHGSRLGLLVGDVLSSINGVAIDHLSSTEALLLFRTQSLPFSVSFIRDPPKRDSLNLSGFIFFDDVDTDYGSNCVNTFDTPLTSRETPGTNPPSMTPIDHIHMLSPAGSYQGPFAFVVQNSVEIPFSPIVRSNSSNKSCSSFSLQRDNDEDEDDDDESDYNDDSNESNDSECSGHDHEHYHRYDGENALNVNAADREESDGIDIDADHDFKLDDDGNEDKEEEEREDSFSFNLETADCIPFEFVMSPIQEQTPIDLESNGLTLRQLSCSPNADAFTPEDDGNLLVSDSGFSDGVYEWHIEIVKCDVFRQEIGIMAYDDNGSFGFGAKAVYGCELMTDSVYYASYDEGGKERCFKNLVGKTARNIGWTEKDIITIRMDLQRNRVKFLLNGL